MLRRLCVLSTLLIAFSSCKRNVYVPDVMGYGKMAVNINYKVDNSPLIFDSVSFTNLAGNVYTVSKVQYYISSIKLYNNDQVKYASDSVYYIDARVAATNSFTLQNIPASMYDRISFTIGINNSLNDHAKMPATKENLGMEWPDMMGGGYHFLKLEGHFTDSSTIQYGFAMHIGTNGMQPQCTIYSPINISTSGNNQLNMTMNINEWFKNPTTYNFSKNGVYTMGDTTLMRILQRNGQDVFSIQN